MDGIKRGAVEVHDAIAGTARAYEFIEGLAHALALCVVVGCAFIGIQGGTEDLHSSRVSAQHNLLRGPFHLLGRDSLLGSVLWEKHAADIIRAHRKDQYFGVALAENVPVQSGQSTHPNVVMKDAIAADTFIEYSDLCGRRCCLQASREIVRPAKILIHGRVRSIYNRGSQHDGGRRHGSSVYIDSCEQIPVAYLRGIVKLDFCCLIADRFIVRGDGALMIGESEVDRRSQMEAHRQIRKVWNGHRNGIAHSHSSRRNFHRTSAAEGQRMVASRNDRSFASTPGKMYVRYQERLRAVFIR